MRIDHVVLWVDDPNRALAFYVDAIGLEPGVQGATRGPEAGGSPINHVCLSMSKEEYAALANRLNERGIELTPGGSASFGAQGVTAHSAYFSDPDGNFLEIRHYDREK